MHYGKQASQRRQCDVLDSVAAGKLGGVGLNRVEVCGTLLWDSLHNLQDLLRTHWGQRPQHAIRGTVESWR